MKPRTILLGLASCLALTLASCDRDGNTGNGANDPTSEFESDKTKKTAGSTDAVTDTAAKETTTSTTVDTTTQEKLP